MRIRITFAKRGALRYTGHLDLHKLWERAARRAQLPLAYSQGFHPQPKMSLAAALPLGFSSQCEVLDMRLEREVALDGLPERLNETLPTGIQVSHVEQVDEREPALQTQVVSAEYRITLKGSSPGRHPEHVEGSDLKRRVESVLQTASIPRERRGKQYDLRPLIESMQAEDDTITMRLAAREGATGRPEEVLAELGIAFEGTTIERTQLIFKKNS
jgi:radical SAM-linked protein